MGDDWFYKRTAAANPAKPAIPAMAVRSAPLPLLDEVAPPAAEEAEEPPALVALEAAEPAEEVAEPAEEVAEPRPLVPVILKTKRQHVQAQ